MSNLREIKKRIASVSSTQEITRTMEMVSSAKIARALERAERSQAYTDALADMMFTVAADPQAKRSSPLLADPSAYERALVIAINSDRGLAGGFNIQVERAAEKRIDHFKRHGAEMVELIACGRKAVEHFEDYPYLVMSVAGESDDPSLARARSIANYVVDSFSTGKLGRIDIIYYHAVNRVEQELRVERILPLDPVAMATARGPRRNETDAAKELEQEFEFEPSAKEILENLAPNYVLSMVYQALIDSAAAEHAARRKSMHAATENADDIIADLQRTYNRVRQASITTEITEIVSGANALEEDS